MGLHKNEPWQTGAAMAAASQSHGTNSDQSRDALSPVCGIFCEVLVFINKYLVCKISSKTWVYINNLAMYIKQYFVSLLMIGPIQSTSCNVRLFVCLSAPSQNTHFQVSWRPLFKYIYWPVITLFTMAPKLVRPWSSRHPVRT